MIMYQRDVVEVVYNPIYSDNIITVNKGNVNEKQGMY